jgi:hypothetical protein
MQLKSSSSVTPSKALTARDTSTVRVSMAMTPRGAPQWLRCSSLVVLLNGCAAAASWQTPSIYLTATPRAARVRGERALSTQVLAPHEDGCAQQRAASSTNLAITTSAHEVSYPYSSSSRKA